MSSEELIEVLFVDDEAGFLDLAKRFMGKADERLRIDTTPSPHDALQKIINKEYDAVVSDYQMPGMSGLELESIKHVSLDPLVQDAIDEVCLLDYEMKVERDVGSVSVCGGVLLKELFANVFENAFLHSKGDRLRISTVESEDEILVRVEDDGVGVPDDVKDRIFERGYKGAGSRGSGLGLYLVRVIAAGYGGRVEVGDSELGGARFDVSLKK